MKEILVNSLIEYLPELIGLVFTILSLVVTKKIIPLVKTKISSSQMAEIAEWTKVLVESAQRLDKSGKLENVTKKEYVMEKLMAHVKDLGYDFTDDQLDDIRRSAVLALENVEKLADTTKEELLTEDGGVK